jgi:hypothetical protein
MAKAIPDKTIEQVALGIAEFIADNTVAVAIVLLDKDSNELFRTITNAKAGDEFDIKVPTAADFGVMDDVEDPRRKKDPLDRT